MRPYILFGLLLQTFGLRSTLQASPYTSSLKQFKQPTNERKPHLSCILFGETGCQITCDVICDLYGCQSQARCVDSVSCDCNELYRVSNQNLTVAQYGNLSLTELWNYNFGNGFSSSRIRKRLQRHPNLSKNITVLFRNPHVTGEYVKGKLEMFRSPWTFVRYLRPERGNVNQIFDEKHAFDYDRFDAYFNKTIASIVEKKRDQIELMDHPNALPSLLRYLRDDGNIRYIVSQVLSFPDTNLLNLISNYTRYTKYHVFTHANNSTIVERENDVFQNFKTFLNTAIENLVDQVFAKMMEMKQKHVLPHLMAYIGDKSDVKNLISLLLMFPNDSLYGLMRALVQHNRNDTHTVRSNRKHPTVSSQEIDELVSASVLERLLRIKIAKHESTTTPTTTTTTPPPTTTSVPLRVHIQRFLKDTFGSANYNNKASTRSKKPYPELHTVLVQLVEYLVNSNNRMDNKED